MKIYFKVVCVFFPVFFFLNSCSNSTENHYPPPENSDAPDQCKTLTKPLVVKTFYDGNVVLNSRILIESATVTFQKNSGTLEIDGIAQGDYLIMITGNGEERHIYFDSPTKIKLQLKIDFINPEYLEKITGQNLFVHVESQRDVVFYECSEGKNLLDYIFGRKTQCEKEIEKELLVPDTIRDFLHYVIISKKSWKFRREDILLYVHSAGRYQPPFGEIYDSGECPFLLWGESWVFNDFCCLLFEGAKECKCISSEEKIMEGICSCQSKGSAVAKKVAVKFGENVIWPGQTVRVGKFVIGLADATRFKFEGEVDEFVWDSIFGGKKIEKLWDFISFYMVKVEQ